MTQRTSVIDLQNHTTRPAAPARPKNDADIWGMPKHIIMADSNEIHAVQPTRQLGDVYAQHARRPHEFGEIHFASPVAEKLNKNILYLISLILGVTGWTILFLFALQQLSLFVFGFDPLKPWHWLYIQNQFAAGRTIPSTFVLTYLAALLAWGIGGGRLMWRAMPYMFKATRVLSFPVIIGLRWIKRLSRHSLQQMMAVNKMRMATPQSYNAFDQISTDQQQNERDAA